MVKIELAFLVGWILGFWLGSYIQYRLNKKLREKLFDDWQKIIDNITRRTK